MAKDMDRAGLLDQAMRRGQREQLPRRRSVPEEIEHDARSRRPITERAIVTFRDSDSFPAAGNLLLAVEPHGPGPGRLWHVRSVRITGGQPITNRGDTARVFFFAGALPPGVNDADVADAYRDDTGSNTLPIAGEYGRGEFVLRYPQVLYCVVISGTAARMYTVTGTAEDEPQHAPQREHGHRDTNLRGR